MSLEQGAHLDPGPFDQGPVRHLGLEPREEESRDQRHVDAQLRTETGVRTLGVPVGCHAGGSQTAPLATQPHGSGRLNAVPREPLTAELVARRATSPRRVLVRGRGVGPQGLASLGLGRPLHPESLNCPLTRGGPGRGVVGKPRGWR